MPYLWFHTLLLSTDSRMSWSTVSNATERSKATSEVIVLSFHAPIVNHYLRLRLQSHRSRVPYMQIGNHFKMPNVLRWYYFKMFFKCFNCTYLYFWVVHFPFSLLISVSSFCRILIFVVLMLCSCSSWFKLRQSIIFFIFSIFPSC